MTGVRGCGWEHLHRRRLRQEGAHHYGVGLIVLFAVWTKDVEWIGVLSAYDCVNFGTQRVVFFGCQLHGLSIQLASRPAGSGPGLFIRSIIRDPSCSRERRTFCRRSLLTLVFALLAIGSSFGKQSWTMARVERQKNPTIEQMQQAAAQHRLVMETPQIPPFDQGNLSTLMDHLEKAASLENRRKKAKLAGEKERMEEIRASQKKLAQSEGARQLSSFEKTRWMRLLAGSAAQGAVLSLFVSLLVLAITRSWSWSPLTFLLLPTLWIVLMWNLAPPVFGVSASPKRQRRLAKALSRRIQTAGVYALVARPWLTAVVIGKMPKQFLTAYRARKAAAK